MPCAQVMMWRDGCCVYFKAFVERGDALEELGVAEDGLERIAP